jgi:hypothetical protein
LEEKITKESFMNAGLIIGYVFDQGGDTIDEAEVRLLEVRAISGAGKVEITGPKVTDFGSPITETDSDGYFELPFAWSGADIGAALGKTNLSLAASKDIRYGSQKTTYITRQRITGYLVKNALAAGGLTTSIFDSIPDLLNFAKDLIDSYRKMKAHPLFNTAILTSEGWLILSGTNLVIKL